MENFNAAFYQGLWFEIARLPLSYESQCVNATAQYVLQTDGSVAITNTCYTEQGRSFIATGVAYAPNPSNPANLLVRFDGVPGPEGSYVVLYTDYDRYAVVGSDSKQFWWLLSRTPTVDESVLNSFFASSAVEGYSFDNLIINKGVLNTSSDSSSVASCLLL